MQNNPDVRLIGLAATMLLCLASPAELSSQEANRQRIKPDWLTADKANRKVSLRIVAGLTTVNSGWNFNGYADGDMTIAVPLDWTVEITFTSRDANYPHSVGVVEIVDDMPVSGDDVTMAFPRAFSLDFVKGFFGPREDTFDFKVDRTGKFWLFCGVPPHGRGGMWDYFIVSDGISEPYVEIPKNGS